VLPTIGLVHCEGADARFEAGVHTIGVVVLDDEFSCAVADDRAAGGGPEANFEVLIGFDGGVAVRRDLQDLGGDAGREGQLAGTENEGGGCRKRGRKLECCNPGEDNGVS
jgi:hypothetical protein